ncbi:NTP transferase domain-containing protein, partial [Streptomyces sp. ISL-66]|uniref:DUF6457 domain-containing protein n=1 Tax=Streptomyces sp. ISL-66 TaxID=2819186 RepID=UPI001BE8DF35
PPGGGPLAALDAGLRHLHAHPHGPGQGHGQGQPVPDSAAAGATAAAQVLVLSADLPFLDRDTVRALLDSPGGDGAVLRDADGRDQPLVAAYRAEPLRREIALLAAEHGSLAGLSLRAVTAELDLVPVTAAAPLVSFDCDTWDDLATARARIREHGTVLEQWITAAKTELGIDLAVDTKTLLDLARDAAHGVARPAAPLTTFLVGYAAARAEAAGADPAEAVAEACRKAADLALRWAAEAEAAAGPAEATGSG